MRKRSNFIEVFNQGSQKLRLVCAHSIIKIRWILSPITSWEVGTNEADNNIHFFRCDTCKKGDVNDDSTIDVRDAVLCINHGLGLYLWAYPDCRWLWVLDCNGPPGDCSGDGMTDVLDAIKIIDLI